MVESWLKISRSRACKQAGDPVLRALVTEELLIHYESMQITDVSIKFQSKLWEVIIQVDKVASHGEFSSVFSVRNGHGYNKVWGMLLLRAARVAGDTALLL
ncbi:hypothetical protein Tco_1059545 [Tanacetum coccineum]